MNQASRMNYGANLRLALALICAAGLLLAQGQKNQKDKGGQQGQGAAPAQQALPPNVAKQPTVKSQKEAQEIQAVFQAPDIDTRIKAGDQFVADFPDSEFKATVLYFLAVSDQQKGDLDQSAAYLERCVQADPQNYQALILLARTIAMRTKEFDLDREEKLTAAEKYVNQAAAILKTALKPNPSLTDEQWAAAKKDLDSQIYEVQGVAAAVRNKNDEAIADLKKSIDTAATPDPATMVRLANLYGKTGKVDDGIETINKVLAMPNLNPQVKEVAQAQRDDLMKKKGAAKP